MSVIRYSIIFLFLTFSSGFAEEVKKIGKFKDWEVIQVLDTSGKICFAQSKPVLQSPKKGDREARLFVTFRPTDKISDEVSTTSGASRIMVTAYNKSGSQTIDHYSLMGFTKAYNSAKKNCT